MARLGAVPKESLNRRLNCLDARNIRTQPSTPRHQATTKRIPASRPIRI